MIVVTVLVAIVAFAGGSALGFGLSVMVDRQHRPTRKYRLPEQQAFRRLFPGLHPPGTNGDRK
jgi:hypothetical protein